jgi:DNA-binding Lrp family transcriptional regulator
MILSERPALHQCLLNDWQRGFPIEAEPFGVIASRHGVTQREVLDACRQLQADGAISRIGGIWGAGAGGAAMLCALAVPDAQLHAVAALVNQIPGVNHNYEREHAYKLWFVITGRDTLTVHRQVDALEQATGLRALRLPMRRAYRIDLGFELGTRQGHMDTPRSDAVQTVTPVAVHDERLAALVEEGLPLMAHPYQAWASALHWPVDRVLSTLQRWLAQHTLRRFGVVVRHHNVGFSANAMTVFDVPDADVDALGARLAAQPGITLCYQRARATGWPYNLYCMVHGRDRDTATARLQDAIAQAGLIDHPHETLFSRQRFKQTGGRYFSAPPVALPSETRSSPQRQETTAWT